MHLDRRYMGITSNIVYVSMHIWREPKWVFRRKMLRFPKGDRRAIFGVASFRFLMQILRFLLQVLKFCCKFSIFDATFRFSLQVFLGSYQKGAVSCEISIFFLLQVSRCWCKFAIFRASFEILLQVWKSGCKFAKYGASRWNILWIMISKRILRQFWHLFSCLSLHHSVLMQ